MKTIFVSSTFRDMQFERDILNMRMVPSINEIASKYGDSIALCDLRWGINTNNMDEDSSNKKILDACLNEIDSCRPYMIVFIGDRYGWIPGDDLMKYTIDNHSLLELDDYNISVTELEILYGTFFNPGQFDRTLFYFRNIEGPVPEYYKESFKKNRNKLNDLKKRIKSKSNANIYEYNISWNETDNKWNGYEELADKIVSDVEKLMKESWETNNKLSKYDKEIKINYEYAISNTKHFYGNHTNIGLINYLLDEYINVLAVYGACGMGNTMLLSKLVLDRENVGNFVLPIFCGLTKNSTDDVEVLKLILEFLNKSCFGKDYNCDFEDFDLNVNDLKLMLVEMYNLIENEYQDRKFTIIIDSAELLDYNVIFDIPFCLHTLPENIAYVIGTTSSLFFDKRFPHVLSIKNLDYFDANNIVKAQLANTRKELDDAVIKEIFKKKHSKIPLYIELIIKKLSLMERDDFEKINQNGGDIKAIIEHQIEVVKSCKDTIEDLAGEIISSCGVKINIMISKYILLYITCSKYGISEKSLMNIIDRKGLVWNNLDFKILMQYWNPFFFKDDAGNYRVKHNLFRNIYPVFDEIYDDLIEELEYNFSGKDLSYIEINEYINYCFFGKKYSKYVKFLLNNSTKKVDIAKATYDSIRNKLSSVLHDTDKEDILNEFIKNIFENVDNKKEKRLVFDFFINEFKNVFGIYNSYWRIMAFEILKDWDLVNHYTNLNKIETSSVFTDEEEREEDEYSLYILYEECQRINEKRDKLISEFNKKFKNKTIRKEHMISSDLRKYEMKIGNNLYYFFDVPTKDDCTLYLMCNEYVILKFYRSSASDHCTYDISYDGKSLFVKEADFSHYDIETDITTYEFVDPKNDFTNYKVVKNTERGAINLPIYFKIK